MAYFNQYQYTPQYQSQSSIIWVQGESGARSYMVAPNNTVQLWDSESQVIYLKSADSSGMPSIKILDYTIRDNTSQMGNNLSMVQENVNNDLDVIKAEIQALKTKIEVLERGGHDDE